MLAFETPVSPWAELSCSEESIATPASFETNSVSHEPALTMNSRQSARTPGSCGGIRHQASARVGTANSGIKSQIRYREQWHQCKKSTRGTVASSVKNRFGEQWHQASPVGTANSGTKCQKVDTGNSGIECQKSTR
ncbi:unnamed protein product [Laminaria digitata]